MLIVNERSSAKRAMQTVILSLAGVFAALLAGCGEADPLQGVALYPVKGRVVLADGKPLTSGAIVFHGNKTMTTSTATIEPDGGFLFTSTRGDGLPEGDYRVRVEPAPVAPAKGSAGKTKTSLPFASKYLDEDASELKASVTPDATRNNFEFKLEARNSATSAAPRRTFR